VRPFGCAFFRRVVGRCVGAVVFEALHFDHGPGHRGARFALLNRLRHKLFNVAERSHVHPFQLAKMPRRVLHRHAHIVAHPVSLDVGIELKLVRANGAELVRIGEHHDHGCGKPAPGPIAVIHELGRGHELVQHTFGGWRLAFGAGPFKTAGREAPTLAEPVLYFNADQAGQVLGEGLRERVGGRGFCGGALGGFGDWHTGRFPTVCCAFSRGDKMRPVFCLDAAWDGPHMSSLAEIQTMPARELRAEAAAAKRRDMGRRTLDRAKSNEAMYVYGGLGAAALMGAIGPEGKAYVPAKIMGMDTDLAVGGLALLAGWRMPRGKNRSVVLGAGVALAAGGVKDMTADLAKRLW